MKTKKQKIYFSRRTIYTFRTLLILIFLSLIISAFVDTSTGVGHEFLDININSLRCPGIYSNSSDYTLNRVYLNTTTNSSLVVVCDWDNYRDYTTPASYSNFNKGNIGYLIKDSILSASASCSCGIGDTCSASLNKPSASSTSTTISVTRTNSTGSVIGGCPASSPSAGSVSCGNATAKITLEGVGLSVSGVGACSDEGAWT